MIISRLAMLLNHDKLCGILLIVGGDSLNFTDAFRDEVVKGKEPTLIQVIVDGG